MFAVDQFITKKHMPLRFIIMLRSVTGLVAGGKFLCAGKHATELGKSLQA